MYTIEFVGLPGAGKSSILKRLMPHLKNNKKDIFLKADEALMQVARYKVDKIFRVVLRLLPYPFALFLSNKLKNRTLMQFEAQNLFLALWGKSFEHFLASEIYENMTSVERTRVIAAFLEIGAIFECIKQTLSIHKVVLFDECFIQKALMFISTEINYIDQQSVIRYLDHIPLPNLIIYVKANPKICVKRMYNRPSGLTNRLMNKNKHDIFIFLNSANELFTSIISYIKRKHLCKILEVENSHDIDKISMNLAETIIRYTET